MAEPTTIIVGLKLELLTSMTEEQLKESGLRWAGYGYESQEIWIFSIEKSKGLHEDTNIDFELYPEDRGDKDTSIYGIIVAQTWNGAIELFSLRERINKAKKLFKEITGLEAFVYVIGGQV